MRPRRRSLIGALGVVTLAGSLLTTVPGAASGAQGLRPLASSTSTTGAAARAVRVLEEADSAVRGASPHRDTSLALLALARAQASLPSARRAEAARILARPTDGRADPAGFGYRADARATRSCEGGFCVHWARATGDAPDLLDEDRNGRPDYVDRVLATLIAVGDTYARAGYRSPLGDGVRGGSGEFDVYLVNTGTAGIYGYCAPEGVVPARRSASAYCVLDNDFVEFGNATPLQNLQVTVAHEYFHAVQFAYDATEDFWFLEATAAWVEDEVFDDVNDNLQYLRSSPIAQPQIPLDRGRGLRVYGSWIFFRYLSELEPRSRAGLPTIVRDILRRAAGATSSIHAVEAVLARRGRSLSDTLARFAAANHHPARHYAEGRHYPAARPAARTTVPAGSARAHTLVRDHLSSGTVRYRPGARTGSASRRLRIVVDLPSRERTTAAVVTVRDRSGALRTRSVRISGRGAGRIQVPFSRHRVRYVDVTLVNAGTRYRCGRGTVYSCRGTSLDDRLELKVRARAI